MMDICTHSGRNRLPAKEARTSSRTVHLQDYPSLLSRRRRSKMAKLARPYICRLSIFNRFMNPSTIPFIEAIGS